MKKRVYSAREWIAFGTLVVAVCVLSIALARMSGFSAPTNVGIRIAEVMADNGAAWRTEAGYLDWIEIENASDETVDLSGWKIACGLDTRLSCALGVESLAPGERAVLSCAPDSDIAFGIPRAGARLSLLDASGQVVDAVSTPPMAPGEAYARGEETGEWALTQEYTPGLPNTSESFVSLAYPDAVGAAIHINELMPKNRTTVADADGNYSDWLELYNATDAEIDLTGWRLTDDMADREKLSLDGVAIGAGEYLIVWLTGSKGTGFALDADGESVWLLDADGKIAGWVSYAAIKKDQSLSRAADGSYVTILAPTPGRRNTAVDARMFRNGGYETLSGNAQGIYVNEVAAAYSTNFDWIELFNSSGMDRDISGWGISDDRSAPGKWTFPNGTVLAAGGYAVVCLTGDEPGGEDAGGLFYAEGFALSFDGDERAVLSDAAGVIVDEVAVKGVSVDVSIGRADGYDSYRYFTKPTPGRANVGTSYAKRADEVEFSLDGGIMETAPVRLSLSADEGATIYYTLDGSEPGANSYVYAEPFVLTSTTVVRAKAVAQDMLDSYVTARTYVFAETTGLRLVAISGDAASLSGAGGILNTGAKEDVVVSCEIYDYDGSLMAAQLCGMRMSGHSSRVQFPQKAFTLRAKRIYGISDFDCALFAGRDADEYDSFVMRASGQDVFQTHMRDSILTSLAAGTGLFYQETELSVLYVNGKYWGVYNMREHVNLDAIARFEGASPNCNIDFLEGDVRKYTLAGSRSTYDRIMDKVEDVGLSSEEVVGELSKYVDIDNYLTYVAIQMYTANLDLNNLRAYRVDGGQWKWVLYDLDLSFQIDKDTPRMWLEDENAGTITAQDNTLFREMMKNAGLRDRFLTRMGELLAANFSSQTVAGKIYARYEMLAPDMAAQCARWGTSVSTWNRYVKKMLSYAEKRPRKLVGYLTDAFSLTDAEIDLYFSAALAAADAYVRPSLSR